MIKLYIKRKTGRQNIIHHTFGLRVRQHIVYILLLNMSTDVVFFVAKFIEVVPFKDLLYKILKYRVIQNDYRGTIVQQQLRTKFGKQPPSDNSIEGGMHSFKRQSGCLNKGRPT